MLCKKIVIFYEKHSDKSSTKTLKEMLPFFQEMGVKSYCEELPHTYNLATAKELWQDAASSYTQQHIDLSNYLKWLKKNKHDEDIPKIKSKIKSVRASKEAYIENVRLLDECSDLEMNYRAIDTAYSAEDEQKYGGMLNKHRDTFMSENILDQCVKYGDVVVKVGLNHTIIGRNLESVGVGVKEYYISSELSFSNTFVNYNPQKPYINGLMIDLYTNPNQDPVELIKADCVASHNNGHFEL